LEDFHSFLQKPIQMTLNNFKIQVNKWDDCLTDYCYFPLLADLKPTEEEDKELASWYKRRNHY